MDFTPTQREAIGHRDGHLQLIACAGSGKTEVVARRVVELLRPRADGDRLVPGNIVAFTFTEKAAAELKDRIVRRVRDELGPTPGMAEEPGAAGAVRRSLLLRQAELRSEKLADNTVYTRDT